MKKSIKVLATMFMLLLIVVQLSTVTFAKTDIPSATSDFYVNDFAGVFSEAEKEVLMENAVTLSDQYDGTQVVVTTIESLGGDSIENYALEMYNQYGIGKDDMGLLVLLSTGDRQIRVEVGKAMEAYINDSKAGRFMDQYAIPSLAEDQFAEGLINLQEAFVSEIRNQLDEEATNASTVADSETSTNFSVIWVFQFIFAVFIIILVTFVIYKVIKKNNETKETIATLTEKLKQAEENQIAIQKQASRAIDASRIASQNTTNALREKYEALASKYSTLEDNFQKLQDRYRRVQILYPTADQDVTKMIEEEIRKNDIKHAEKVDSIIQEVIDLQPNKDFLLDVEKAISAYANLSTKQKTYVASDISKLQKLYQDCQRLKQEYDKQVEEERNKKHALEAATAISGIISGISIGRARNLRELKRAKSLYKNLNSGSLKYFDHSIVDKLDNLLRQAKRDQEEIEEEERRRKRREEEERRRRMNSSSSFGNSSYFGGGSHFGGFGGSSGGGGASRGF